MYYTLVMCTDIMKNRNDCIRLLAILAGDNLYIIIYYSLHHYYMYLIWRDHCFNSKHNY